MLLLEMLNRMSTTQKKAVLTQSTAFFCTHFQPGKVDFSPAFFDMGSSFANLSYGLVLRNYAERYGCGLPSIQSYLILFINRKIIFPDYVQQSR